MKTMRKLGWMVWLVMLSGGCRLTGAGEGDACSGHQQCRVPLLCHEKVCVTEATVKRRRKALERETRSRIEQEGIAEKKRREAEMKAMADMLQSLETDSEEVRKAKAQLKKLEEQNAAAVPTAKQK